MFSRINQSSIDIKENKMRKKLFLSLLLVASLMAAACGGGGGDGDGE